MKIREIMNEKVEHADPTLPISKAAEKMRDLDIGKRLVGVVSLGDIAKLSVEREVAGETLGKIAEAA